MVGDLAARVTGILALVAAFIPQPTYLTAEQQQHPTFKTGVDLTLVPVHVRDKDGRPISGLCDAAFRLFANNRERPIRHCEFISALPPIAAARNRPESDVRDNWRAGPFGRRFVVVVDDLHLIEQDAFSIKRIATHFIDGLSSSDEVAVVFVGRSDLGQDFTNSRERLLRVIDRVPVSLGFGWTRGPHRSTPARSRGRGRTYSEV